MAIASPFTWVGGKAHLAKEILPFPHHLRYVEVFGGGGSLLFAKTPSSEEILNDNNGRLINAYRQIQSDVEKLTIECIRSGSLASRKIGDECIEISPDPITDAFRFLYLNKHSFSGLSNRFTSRNGNCSSHHDVFMNTIARFRAINRRIRDVIFENQDFRRIVKRFDSPNTLFYCDPPYLQGGEMYEQVTGGHEWTLQDFTDLVDLLRQIQGKFVLSYDTVDWMTEEDKKHWTVQTVARMNRMNADGGRNQKQCTEYIVRNFKPKIVKDWLIELTEKETNREVVINGTNRTE